MELASVVTTTGFALFATTSLASWILFHLVVQARLAEASIKVEEPLMDVLLRYPRRRLGVYAAQLSEVERRSVLNRFVLVWAPRLQWLGLALFALGLWLQRGTA